MSSGPQTSTVFLIIGGILALGGVFLVYLGAANEYLKPDPGNRFPGFAIFDCGYEGCGWFAVESLAIIGITIGLEIVILAVARARVAAAASLTVTGVWAILLYLGYWGYANNADPSITGSAGSAGIYGMAGGALILAAGIIAFFARPRSK